MLNLIRTAYFYRNTVSIIRLVSLHVAYLSSLFTLHLLLATQFREKVDSRVNYAALVSMHCVYDLSI